MNYQNWPRAPSYVPQQNSLSCDNCKFMLSTRCRVCQFANGARSRFRADRSVGSHDPTHLTRPFQLQTIHGVQWNIRGSIRSFREYIFIFATVRTWNSTKSLRRTVSEFPWRVWSGIPNKIRTGYLRIEVSTFNFHYNLLSRREAFKTSLLPYHCLSVLILSLHLRLDL